MSSIIGKRFIANEGDGEFEVVVNDKIKIDGDDHYFCTKRNKEVVILQPDEFVKIIIED